MRATKVSGTQWGSRLGVVAQPPLLKIYWRNWSACPLLLKGARSPQPPPLKKWWLQEHRRALHQLPSPQRRQRSQRRKKRCPPRLDW
jgi:hypothetical protein